MKGIALCLARSGNGRTFIGTSEFKILELDLAAPKPEAKELGAHESYVTGVAVAGSMLVSGGYDGRLIWWDIESRKQVRAVDAHGKWIRRVRAARDGSFVVSVGDDMVARVWDVPSGKLRHELRGHAAITPHHFPSMLHACAIAPDGRHLATADKTGKIVVWNSQSGAKASAMEAPGMYTWDPVQRRHSIGGPRALAFSPDGSQLAVGGIGQIGNIDHLDGKARVEVFDWKAAKRTYEFASDKINGLVNHLEYHPKGEWLLALGGAGDGFMMFLDLAAKKALKQDKAPAHIHDAWLGEGGEKLVVAAHGRVLNYEIKDDGAKPPAAKRVGGE